MEGNATNFEVLIDISATETPAYTKLCVTNISHDKGESLDTWFDLCSKFANNEIVAYDPTFGLTFKFKQDDPAKQFVLGKEWATGAAATAAIRIVNKLKGANGKQIDFVGLFTNITYEAETPTILEVTTDVKVNSGTTFVESDYATPSI